MNKYFFFSIFFISIASLSCNSSNDETGQTKKEIPVQNTTIQSPERQLNITILLDLSDRINPQRFSAKPEHYERDLEIVKSIAEIFKSNMNKLGAYGAKGKLKVFCLPPSTREDITDLTRTLDVDLSNMNPKQKKDVYDNLNDRVSSSINKIYSIKISENQWPGSDVWRFFKNDVKDYCVIEDPDYRNILVILTDGYIYHDQSKYKERNRTSYITAPVFSQNGFRNNMDWHKKFISGDFGLITKRNDLSDLEIIVLEVNAPPSNKGDEDIIKVYLEKWFSEMGVKRYAIYNTDLPSNTSKRVDSFFKKNQ